MKVRQYHLQSDLARNGYLVAVRRFGAFIQTLSYTDHNPGEHVKGWGTGRKHRRHHLPVADAKAFLHVLETDPAKTLEQRIRDATIAYLMLKTGLREIEVSRARLSGLKEVEGGWRLYVQGKGRTAEDDYVRLMQEVWDRLSAYLHIRGVAPGGEGTLFVTVGSRNTGGAVLQRAGLPISTRTIQRELTKALLLADAKRPGIVVHSLRHSAPTYALLNGADPIQVQKMMRHKRYATTEIYVEDVKRMVEGAEDKVTQL